MKFLIPVSEEEQQEKIEQKEAYCRLFSKGGGKNGEPKETIACKNEL
ncbi:MAG: hypothetical protein H2212_12760 [Ruminococcus sp.]|nr:hypothetical protein [Ruminococcus sp.]